ncbi:hypothetical protein YC2023_044959 [Brassica napus]
MYSSCNPKQTLVLPRSFISNSFLRYSTVWAISPGVPMMFKSSTYTAMITNPLFANFFIKIHGLIGSFLYPTLARYSLKRLYHIRPLCLSPYKDLFSLMQCSSREPLLALSSIPSGNLIYISLSSGP